MKLLLKIYLKIKKYGSVDMPNCQIAINGIKKNLTIERPSFLFFKTAYKEIFELRDDDGNLMSKLKEAIKKQLKIYNIRQEYANAILAKVESTLDRLEQSMVYPRYVKVGGNVLEEYARFVIDDTLNELGYKLHAKRYQNFSNSCALQVSYAFNYGKMPIKSLCTLPANALMGNDGHLYYTGVPKIKELLLKNWKQLKPFSKNNNKDFYKVFYVNKSQYQSILTNPTSRQKVRDENQKFFTTLTTLKQNGIITMDIDGWGNAVGHTTFFDSKSGRFLDDYNGEYNYLDYADERIFVRELCFWKI